MSSAELTVFFCLQTFWMILLFFCHVVITLFTFCTCQCDSYAHDFSTSMCLLSQAASRNCLYATSCYGDKDLLFVLSPPHLRQIRHKKKTYFHCRCSSVSQKQAFVKPNLRIFKGFPCFQTCYQTQKTKFL